MKVGIDATCLEAERGGVARILTNLLLRWPGLTTEHRFVLYFEREVPQDDFLTQDVFEHRVVRRPAPLRGSTIPREQVLLPLQIRRDGIDLFFAPWYYAPLFCPSPKTVVGAWDISYTTHRAHYPFKAGLRLSLFSRISCRHASGILTCSHFDKRQIERHYGVPADRICVLLLAPDPKFTDGVDLARIEALRRKYSLPDKYILSMGAIFNRRHVDVIIDAFKSVCSDYPDVGLVVVGRNRTVPAVDIEGLMGTLVENGRGMYLARAPEEDLIDLYKGAWYYVCLSSVDGEATMLKEAMRCGTPVITSRLLEEAVAGNAVVVSDPTDRAEMARILRRTIPDTALRDRLAKDGLEWSRALSWDRVAETSLRFLESR